MHVFKRFDNNNELNNAILNVVQRVAEVQIQAPMGYLGRPAAFISPTTIRTNALIGKLDAICGEINQTVTVIRAWLSNTPAPEYTGLITLLPPYREAAPPSGLPLSFDVERELVKHVDFLSDAREVAQDKRALLHNLQKTKMDLSNFQFVRKLGQGAYSSVYLAKRISTGSYVALKAMDKAKIREAGMAKRVVQEQCILRASCRTSPGDPNPNSNPDPDPPPLTLTIPLAVHLQTNSCYSSRPSKHPAGCFSPSSLCPAETACAF